MHRKTKLLKIVSLIFIFYFSLLVSFPLFSQSNPIVQVDPVVNLSDEVWLDAVCDAATDNVVFTLKFLGQFDVKSDSTVENESGQLVSAMEIDDQETFNTSLLKTRAETEGYDNILFGSCTIEDGSYVITMNAYDLALDKITYSGSTEVESIFDTFEAVDEITYLTVEGFSGIHVTYGSLILVPPGTGEPFSFTIDGTALPEGTFSVDRMPAGVHKLAVWQERPLGLYEAVYEILVEEEKENRIDISLPNITGEEITVFNQADRYLTLTSMGKDPGMPLAMNNLYSLMDTPFFQEFRPGLVEKYEIWVSKLDNNSFVYEETQSFNISLINQSLWEIDKHKSVSNDNVAIIHPFIETKIRKEFTSLKIVSTINYSGGRIHGITIANGNLWITDQRNGTLNQIDMNTGAALSTINLVGSHNLTGLTYRSENGHFYYTHDDSPLAILETDLSGAVLGSFPAIGGDSTGLTIYRDYIYNADFSNGGQFHKMKIDNPEISQSFPSPSNTPEGLTWAYGSLWNIDLSKSTLYQINAADFSVLNKFIIPNTENILGLAFDGTYFWVSDGNSLYKILLE